MNINIAPNGLNTEGEVVRRSAGWLTVLSSLLTPICLGLSLYFLLSWSIVQGHLQNEVLLRYLTGHPVSKVTVGMFLVGVASLSLIGWNLFEQFAAEKKITLSEIEDGDWMATTQTSSDGSSTFNSESEADGFAHDRVRGFEEEANRAVAHGEQLTMLPKWTRQHYLWNRLLHTLHYIYRSGSVSGVEEEMKYLAERDEEDSHQRYSLCRILIWATPMLGFLGTVLGISQALGGISVGPDNDFQAMMSGLQSNLYVAFDTTALALTLSMVLMFCQFITGRFESQLLKVVDQRCRREVSKHFDLTMASSSEGSFDRIGREVLEATRDVVRNQTEIWKNSISAAEKAWASTLTQTSEVVQNSMSQSLDENVAALADYLGQSIDRADLSISHRWEQWQSLLSRNANLMKDHQSELMQQTRTVEDLVKKLDDSTAFENALAHQRNAIDATTKMHDVLTRVSGEIASQNEQLKQQREEQMAVSLASNSRQVKEAEGHREDILAFRSPHITSTESVVAGSKPGNSGAQGVDKLPADVRAMQNAPVSGRRRDPEKPVIFLRSQNVAAIRKFAVPQREAEATTAKPRADAGPVSQTDSRKLADATESTDRAILSIESLKQNVALSGNSGQAVPDLVMPAEQRMLQRNRAQKHDANVVQFAPRPQDSAASDRAAAASRNVA